MQSTLRRVAAPVIAVRVFVRSITLASELRLVAVRADAILVRLPSASPAVVGTLAVRAPAHTIVAVGLRRWTCAFVTA